MFNAIELDLGPGLTITCKITNYHTANVNAGLEEHSSLDAGAAPTWTPSQISSNIQVDGNTFVADSET